MRDKNNVEFVIASLVNNTNIFCSKLIFMNRDFDFKKKNHNFLVKLPQYFNSYI